MPRKPKAKPPAARSIYRVFIPDIESYSEFISKPPYIYFKRVLLQHVACQVFIEASLKGHFHIELVTPIETLAESYRCNPAQMALVIRRTGADRLPSCNIAVRMVNVEDLKLTDSDVQKLVAQPEPGTRYVVISTSDQPVEIRAGFLMKVAALFLGKPLGYSVVLPAEDMGRSYFEKPRYLGFQVQKRLREQLNNPTLSVVTHRLENGVRLSTVPQEPINAF